MTPQAEVIADAYEAIIRQYQHRLDLADVQRDAIFGAALAVGDARTLRAIQATLKVVGGEHADTRH